MDRVKGQPLKSLMDDKLLFHDDADDETCLDGPLIDLFCLVLFKRRLSLTGRQVLNFSSPLFFFTNTFFSSLDRQQVVFFV